MVTTRSLSAALLALVPLVSACKKSENKKPEPAPAPAPAAAPTPAPAPPAAPPAADMKVSVKTSSDTDSGDYDGATGIYINSAPNRILAIAKGCPTFTCGMVTYYGSVNDAWKKDCAHARWLQIKIGDDSHKDEPKVGATPSEIEVGMDGASNGVTDGKWVDGLTLTEVAPDHISGTIKIDAPNQVHGSFKAKVCP